MIYAVEGNVNVGKTSYIKNFLVYNKEYTYVLENESKYDNNVFIRQLYYINEEIKRAKKYSNKKNLIIDRSILSQIVYIKYSNELNNDQKELLFKIILNNICEKKFLIPEYIIFFITNYKNTIDRHNLLFINKKTERTLVDYNYWSMYNYCFANLEKCSNNAFVVTNYNHYKFIRIENFYNVALELIGLKNNTVICIDGPTSVGKTTLLSELDITNNLKKIDEDDFPKPKKNETFIERQISFIIQRINVLKENNIIVDTSFLINIVYLFYGSGEMTKQEKIFYINFILKKTNPDLFIDKIIFLDANKEILINRMKNDNKRTRPHFYENIILKEKMKNFYMFLNDELDKRSNILLIDTGNKNTYEIKEIIDNFMPKKIFLIDLFECIKSGVMKGCI